jgi:hypothetical protein
MSYQKTISALASKNQLTLSDLNIKSFPTETRIAQSLKWSHEPSTRSNWCAQVHGDKKVRYAVMDNEGNLVTFHSPVLVEDLATTPPTPTMIAVYGDDIISTSLVKMDPNILTSHALVLCTEADKDILGLSDLGVSPTDLLDEADDSITLTNARLGWPEAVPGGTLNGANIVVVPLAVPIPPTYWVPHGQPVATAFPAPPADSSGSGAWEKLHPIQRIMKYMFENNDGLSCQATSSPLFSNTNWLSTGPGNDAMLAGGNHLTSSMKVRMEFIPPTSLLAKDAITQIRDNLVEALRNEVDSIEITNQPPPPQNNNGGMDFAEVLGKFASSIENVVQNKDSEKSERKTIRDDTKTNYKILGSKVALNDHGITILETGELSDEFERLMNKQLKSTLATALQQGIQSKYNEHKAKKTEIGIQSELRVDVLNTAFATIIQAGQWHYEPIQFCKNGLDAYASILQFTPVNTNNKAYKELIQSERMAQLEDAHETDEKKKAIKAKNLFIDGEQSTRSDLIKTTCNFMLFITYIFRNAEGTFIYQSYNKLLDLFNSPTARNWFDLYLPIYPHIVHSVVCQLHQVFACYWNRMVVQSNIQGKLREGEDIPADDILVCKSAADAIYNLISSEMTSGGSHYAAAPPSYAWNLGRPLTTPNPSGGGRGGGGGGGVVGGPSPVKKQKIDDAKKAHTPKSEKADLTDEMIEKFKKAGWLETKSKTADRMAHTFSTHNNKEFCKGFCYKGRYCSNKQGACTKAHISNLGSLPASDQEAVEAWVKKTNGVSFVEGKGPKTPGK